MKRVKIDFDFSKWGQEGISVVVDSKDIFTIHKNPIKTTWYYGLFKNGYTFSCLVEDITMYQEVEPREIWVNEYNGELVMFNFISKEEADRINNYEARQVKFVEAIE